MNKKEVDHVPVGFWFHFAGEEASGEGCIKAHLKYYRETDLDFVKSCAMAISPYPLPEIRGSRRLENTAAADSRSSPLSGNRWKEQRLL